jgi:hypothetical protein
MATKRICPITNCGNPVVALGYCDQHYRRLRKYGDPLAGRTANGTPLAWIRQHIEYQGLGCLAWPFGRNKWGYGKLRYRGTVVGAHRVMCAEAHGKPPSPTHEAAHSCGKGHLGCISPAHLSWKTPTENQADRIIHGTDIRGDRHRRAKLTGQQVKEIRQSPYSNNELSKIYGVSVCNIRLIRQRKTWLHIP